MKFTLLIISFLLLSGIQAQKKDVESRYILYDNDWKPVTNTKKAKYITKQLHPNDSTWQVSYYNISGPLISIETYRDWKYEIPNGYCAWFDSTGQIDSAGHSYYGKKHGDWFFFNDKLTIVRVDHYEYGKLTLQTDGKVYNEKKPLEQGDSEASFRDGPDEWKRYLQKNFQFPQRLIKSRMGGTVQVAFAIDTLGEVNDIRIFKSVEITIDNEVIRLIGASPKWNPAVKNGVKVMAYRRQPFTAIATGN